MAENSRRNGFIKNWRRHFPFIQNEKNAVFGVIVTDKKRLQEIGFTENPQAGEEVLPSVLGIHSKINAEGKIIIRKDLPKEEATRQILWHWMEWHGPYRVQKSRICEINYQRYPREVVSPPAVELRIASISPKGEYLVVSPVIQMKNNDAAINHVLNLFRELLGECHAYTEQLEEFYKTPTKKVNWIILPSGKMPWSELDKILKPIINKAPKGNQPLIRHRLKVLYDKKPDLRVVGSAGFSGYIILGYTAKGIFVLESAYYGNATYVFGRNWEELSKLTKAEIIREDLQKFRFIHREGWENLIEDLFSSEPSDINLKTN